MSSTRTDGLFITFEGVEGAGKTTQIELLSDRLQALGHPVCTTREPGGEPVAEAIRKVILSEDHPVDTMTELLLFVASRAQVTARVIRPHLEAGYVVICDRFIDSTVAYQGYARGHQIDTIQFLNTLATGGLMPDLTILLDIDPERGIARQMQRNRMEGESLEFHRRVYEGYRAEVEKESGGFLLGFPLPTSKRRAVRDAYLKQVPLNPGRYWVVDAEKPIRQISDEVFHYVSTMLPEQARR